MRRERVDEVLSAVGLDASVRPRYPHELSGGQLRRVALARILLLQPRIIVLDEPTSGLDMSVQATILNLLLEMRRRLGLTYLFISHDLSVVERLCDRVAIMYLGRIVELASAEEIFARPLHPYTRALLAAAPRLDPEPRRVSQRVVGEPPSAAALPPGCVFATRCPHIEASLHRGVATDRKCYAGARRQLPALARPATDSCRRAGNATRRGARSSRLAAPRIARSLAFSELLARQPDFQL